MSTGNANAAASTEHLRTFEQYLEANQYERIKGKHVRCSGCHRTDLKCWAGGTANRAVACEACLRYMWGYDQAQAATVRIMVGAAVAGLDGLGDHELNDAAVAEGLHDARTERIVVVEGDRTRG
jgi:hypothetical protein